MAGARKIRKLNTYSHDNEPKYDDIQLSMSSSSSQQATTPTNNTLTTTQADSEIIDNYDDDINVPFNDTSNSKNTGNSHPFMIILNNIALLSCNSDDEGESSAVAAAAAAAVVEGKCKSSQCAIPFDRSKHFSYLINFGFSLYDISGSGNWCHKIQSLYEYIVQSIDTEIVLSSSKFPMHEEKYARMPLVNFINTAAIMSQPVDEQQQKKSTPQPSIIVELTSTQNSIVNTLLDIYKNMKITEEWDGVSLSSENIYKIYIIGSAGTGKTTILSALYRKHKRNFLYLTQQHILCREVIKKMRIPENQVFTFTKFLMKLCCMSWPNFIKIQNKLLDLNCQTIYRILFEIRRSAEDTLQFKNFNETLEFVQCNIEEPLIICVDEFSMIPNNLFYLFVCVLDVWCIAYKRNVMLISCGDCHQIQPLVVSKCGYKANNDNDHSDNNNKNLQNVAKVYEHELEYCVRHPFDVDRYNKDNLNYNNRCLFAHGRGVSDKYIILKEHMRDTRQQALSVHNELPYLNNAQLIKQLIMKIYPNETKVRFIDFTYPSVLLTEEILNFFEYPLNLPPKYSFKSSSDKKQVEPKKNTLGSRGRPVDDGTPDSSSDPFLNRLYKWWQRVANYFNYFYFRSWTNLDAHFINLQTYYSVYNQQSMLGSRVHEQVKCRMASIYFLDLNNRPRMGIFTWPAMPLIPLIIGLPYKLLKSYLHAKRGEILILLYIHYNTPVFEDRYLVFCKESEPDVMLVIRPDIVNCPLFCSYGSDNFQYQYRNDEGVAFAYVHKDNEPKRLLSFPVDLAIGGTLRSSIGCTYNRDLYLNLSGGSKEEVYVACTRVCEPASIKGILL